MYNEHYRTTPHVHLSIGIFLRTAMKRTLVKDGARKAIVSVRFSSRIVVKYVTNWTQWLNSDY